MKFFSIFGCVFLSSPDYISEKKKFSRIVGCVFDTQIVYSRGGDTVPFETSENDGTEMIMGKEKRPLVSRRCGNSQWFLKNVFNQRLLTFLSAFCFSNYAASSLKNLP